MFKTYLKKETSILPLAIFRMAFGFLMCFSMLRFMYNGWIEECYIIPNFHFTYQYFDWVNSFDTTTMYVLVTTCALSALFLGLGFLYRFSTVIFLLTFTYLELIEKSWYLNHYYFVSLVGFLLILVPAHRNYSIDSTLNSSIRQIKVPTWSILSIKLQLCIVYFFGGIAKLKSDWLFDAQPLNIWLKAKTGIPLIGGLFEYEIVPYLFSWTGTIYDLTIPFLLWTKKTRPLAYVLVVVFHVLTSILFNIGMFPWLMIFGSLIFITHKEWSKICFFINQEKSLQINNTLYKRKVFVAPLLILFFSIQVLLPIRHFFLSDNVLWTENGFRFAWHVMVMEKSGYVDFTIKDNNSNKRWKDYPSRKLTVVQEKQMSFQPDMIWQYAQYLKEIYKEKGVENISIYSNSRVSLNGRLSQPYINSTKDLLEIKNVNSIYSYIHKLK